MVQYSDGGMFHLDEELFNFRRISEEGVGPSMATLGKDLCV